MRWFWVVFAAIGCSSEPVGMDGGVDNVPAVCSAPCLADAAADFDGSPGGVGNRWRYLNDRRNRTWTPMTAMGGVMVGESRTRIARCADEPAAAACQGLPGGLLVTTGHMDSSDPALEYRSPDARVIRIALEVYIPLDIPVPRVHLYRNSRDDLLFTGVPQQGSGFKHELTLDALPEDRFLVAFEPFSAGYGGGTIAVRFSITDTGTAFPSTCQLAVPFSIPGSTSAAVADLCGGELVQRTESGTPVPVTLRPSPYPELGMAGHVEHFAHYQGIRPLDRSRGITIQFWYQNDSLYAGNPLFTDANEGAGGGLRIQIGSGGLYACRVETTAPAVKYECIGGVETSATWSFVRVTHVDNHLTICVNGRYRLKKAILDGPLPSVFPPYIGATTPTTSPQFFDGDIDDLRVSSDTLPCY